MEGQNHTWLLATGVCRLRYVWHQRNNLWHNNCPLLRNPHSGAGEGGELAMLQMAELPARVREVAELSGPTNSEPCRCLGWW